VDAGIVGGPGSKRGTLSQHHLDEFGIEEDDDFEIILSPGKHGGNWIELPPEAWTILVRQTFFDKKSQRGADLRIERVGQDAAPEPLDHRHMASGLRRAAGFAVGWTRIVLQLREMYSEAANRLVGAPGETKRQYGADPDIHYVTGYWRLAPDEALVIDLTPPRRFLYWGFQLCNDWLESLDYRYFNVATNNHRATSSPDGTVRLVVAQEDPGLPNWLETTGHSEGGMFLRWLLAEDDPPVPEMQVVRVSELRE
jgi:hypothetical protein